MKIELKSTEFLQHFSVTLAVEWTEVDKLFTHKRMQSWTLFLVPLQNWTQIKGQMKFKFDYKKIED